MERKKQEGKKCVRKKTRETVAKESVSLIKPADTEMNIPFHSL